MDNYSGNEEWILLCAVVNFGVSNKVMNVLKQQGITGGTIFLGKGTVKNHLLEILDLNDIRKEIVLSITMPSLADRALEALNKQLALYKPHHGIAFTIPVKGQVGVHHPEAPDQPGKKNNRCTRDCGPAEDAVKLAARGDVRGSGIHEQRSYLRCNRRNTCPPTNVSKSEKITDRGARKSHVYSHVRLMVCILLNGFYAVLLFIQFLFYSSQIRQGHLRFPQDVAGQ